MAEVLSQQEIDLLLNNAKSGQETLHVESSDKEIIPFDFRLPNRVSKNQLRTIRNIHELFSESFSSFLVSKLQAMVTINVTSIDQIYYSEYVLSVGNPACLFTFQIGNMDIKGILELNTDLALNLVDRLLGGIGKGNKQTKIITPIEQKVLNVIVERVMMDLNKSWQSVENLDFQIERFEPDIDFAQITSQNEAVLVISFELIIAEQSYMMNLCFATFAFDSILAKMSSQKFSSVKPVKYKGTTAKEIISNHLFKTGLPVVVEFGTAKITVNDLLELKKGDIIKLNNRINEDHLVKVSNINFFNGRAGIANNHKAIKITNMLYREKK